jgi:hypothetical protein
VVHARVVLGQQVPGEVAAQVAPHGVDVIGLVLGVVVLDEQARTAEGVIVAGAWLDRPGPSEAHLVAADSLTDNVSQTCFVGRSITGPAPGVLGSCLDKTLMRERQADSGG